MPTSIFQSGCPQRLRLRPLWWFMALPAELQVHCMINNKTKEVKYRASPSEFQCIRFSAQLNRVTKSQQQAPSTKPITRKQKQRTRRTRDLDQHHRTTQLRIAYEGIPGAYSEVAAKLACLDCTTISCRAIADAIEAVETGQADRAILPVESTTEGEVRNYNLLLERGLHITQEINLFIHYCLLAIHGVRKEEVKKVISHPVALSHCQEGLARLGMDALQEAVHDTAGAVELLLSQNMNDTAAIASAQAAKIYGLQVLAQGLQDEPWNVTRFLILSKNPTVPMIEHTIKTSIVIAHHGGMQPLLRVLSAFSSRKINLTKLEVKNSLREPIRILDTTEEGVTKKFQHVFYVDVEGSMDDQKVLDAIAEISLSSLHIRILGCYAADTKIYDL